METKEVICAFSKKPLRSIKRVQNDFFKVDSFIKKGTFFLSIKPQHKMKLIPQVFDLTQDDEVYQADVTSSKIWVVLGYLDKMPLINNKPKPDLSLNLPFYMKKNRLPYVGSLDIKGNPVYIKKVGDVKDYLRVKKLYKEKKYEACMDTISDVLEGYPNTLFKAELIYYKIKLYSQIHDYDNVVSSAKIFLREYSSSDNIPEVLALTADAYAQIGLNTDADYFFDRLFSEHKNSIFSLWGYIYKGGMLEANGDVAKAIKFYKKALFETKDLEVAATAAFDIAKAKLDISPKSASTYIDEIVDAKPSYFNERLKESKEMMEKLSDNNEYMSAAKIAKALLDAINPTYDEYEVLLSKWALWMAQTKDKQAALVALNRYLKEFPDGDYIDSVQVAKDALFFDAKSEDINATTKLAEYNKLIEEYPNDTIGNRAIYEKAKLLLLEKQYSDVLAMKEQLVELDQEKYEDKEQIIEDAAVGTMQTALENKECNEVLVISNEYHITLSNKWDDGVYSCAMKGGDFQLSKKICTNNLKSKDLNLRKKWLYRYIKVDFATGNYSDVLDASKELILLIEEDKDSEYKDIYRYLFDTYDRLEKKDKMIQSIAKIEKIFGLNYKDIERYVSVMSIGSERKDDTMVIKYGSKVRKIQQESNSWAQSPYVEFALYQAYINKEEYNKALEVIRSLDKIELKADQRARQKYFLGTVLSKLWRNDEARVAYKASIKADETSAWAKLAKSALEI